MLEELSGGMTSEPNQYFLRCVEFYFLKILILYNKRRHVGKYCMEISIAI